MVTFNSRSSERIRQGQRVTPGAYTNIQKRVSNTSTYGITTTIADIVPQIIESIADTVGKQASQELEAVFLSNLRGSRPALAHAHERVADRAQRAMLQQYESTLNPGHSAIRGYRPKSRLTGRLGNVLNDPDFVLASANGIAYGNITRLNKEARHWGRLNFGAGPRAGRQGGTHAVRLAGGANFTLRSQGFASPNILMPEGYWRTAGGSFRSNKTGGGFSVDKFFPTGKVANIPTQGTRARNFLDAGVEEMARALPQEYLKMYQNWSRMARTKNRGPVARRIQAKAK
jgi:hypothetical protein